MQVNKTALTALACSAALVLSAAPAVADVAPSDFRQKISDQVWLDELRPAFFQEREIIEGAGQNILELKAPYRAEDAAVVPITIHARIPQGEELYIKKVHILIDKNPTPLVGIFDFTPASGRADLAMRVRVDDFSFVRAIAELNTGELYLAKSFVRATGACSAPPPKSIDDSIANMGRMKMKLVGAVELGQPNLMQIKIKHPNITGLQPMKIGSRVRPPAHFINRLAVSYDGAVVMTAQLTFSISMDPSLRFFFVPQGAGMLTVDAADTKNASWSAEYSVQPGQA